MAHWSPHRALNSSNRAHWASEIRDQFDWIRVCNASAWPWVLPRFDVLPRPAAPPLRPPSRYLSSLFSLTSLDLLWNVDCGLRERERERALSLWTEMRVWDSLSISNSLSFSLKCNWLGFIAKSFTLWLYNYLPLLWLYLLVCSVLVSLSFSVLWFVNLSNWLLLWLLSIKWGVDGAMGPCGRVGGIFELGK